MKKARQIIFTNRRHTDRDAWVDNVKGIAILLVMWWYVQMAESEIYLWFTIFHVQVFFVISGYLYAKQQKHIDSLNRTVAKSVIPYVSFSFHSRGLNLPSLEGIRF